MSRAPRVCRDEEKSLTRSQSATTAAPATAARSIPANVPELDAAKSDAAPLKLLADAAGAEAELEPDAEPAAEPDDVTVTPKREVVPVVVALEG